MFLDFPLERVSQTIRRFSSQGGATAGEIHSALRVPQEDRGVASILAQVSTSIAADRYSLRSSVTR